MAGTRQSKHRRGHGEGSIYQRASDGRWFAALPMPNGKRQTVSAKTRAEVTRKLKDLQRQVDVGVLPTNVSTGDYLHYWLDEIVAHSPKVRARTLAGYRSYVETWMIPHLGHVALQQLTSDHVRSMYRAMRKAGRSETTVRQAHAVLHRALRIARDEGRTVRNAADMGDTPAAVRNPTPHLTLAPARQVLAAAQDSRELARLSCALLLGLRQEEALGLRWEDIDLDDGVMTVVRAVQRRKGAGLVVTDLKSEASAREIPLPPAVRAILTGYRAETAGDGWVFGGYRAGNPTDPRRDYQAWVDALDRAGVSRVPLRGARASAASLLLDMGVSIEVVADILGHAKTVTTRRHYAHTTVEARRAAMDQLGAHTLGELGG